MIARFKSLTVACVVVFSGMSLNSQKVLAQATEGNNIIQPAASEQPPTRSPGLAVGLSLGSTVLLSAIGGGLLATHSEPVKIAGGVILGTGLVLGPSVGQFYSDRWGKGLLFTLGRAVAGLIGAGGFMWGFANAFECMDHPECHKSSNEAGPIALMVVGGASATGLIIWGIVDSNNSAEQFNEEHAKKLISLSPFVMPSAGRNGENGTAYGLAIAGNF